MRRHFAVFAASTLSAGALVAQTPPPAPAAQPAAALDQGYVVGNNDVLDIILVGTDEYRARVTVQADGSIQLPFIGRVVAADKTLLELAAEIARALDSGGYFVDPAIQVTLGQISSANVTVLGEVGAPGLIPMDREYRVSEIIARVGGLKPTGSDTFYLRREGGEEIALTLEQIARGGDNADPLVKAGDKIFVPEAPTFYIYGQINGAGTYPIRGEMSLRMALARAGGLTSLGSDKRITVIRNGEELKKFSLSDPILDDDVIVVGERFF